MILYKDIEAIVCSSDGNTDFFDIVTVVLPRDAFAPYLLRICVDYVLRISIDLVKENGFSLKKKRLEADNIPKKLSWMQAIQTIVLVANTLG